MQKSRKLGQLLLERRLITEEQLEGALSRQKSEGARIGSLLVSMGAIEEEELLTFLALYFDVPRVNLRDVKIHPEALQTVPKKKAKELGVFPVKIVEEITGQRTLLLAVIDPGNAAVVTDVESFTGMKVEAYVTSWGAFCHAVDKYYGGEDQPPRGYENVSTRDLLISLVDSLLESGVLSEDQLKAKIDRMRRN